MPRAPEFQYVTPTDFRCRPVSRFDLIDSVPPRLRTSTLCFDPSIHPARRTPQEEGEEGKCDAAISVRIHSLYPTLELVPLSAHRGSSEPCRSLFRWSLAPSCRSLTETHAVNIIIKRLKKSTAEATPDVAVTTDCYASVLGRPLCKGFVETPSSTRTPCALPSLRVEL